jgi:hypothetical protein
MTLPAGYLLCVQTSENNGLVNIERLLPGLSSAEARMFYEIAKDFTSNGVSDARGAGGDKFIQPAFLSWYRHRILTKHPDIPVHVQEKCSLDMDFYANILCLILGEPSDYLSIRGIYVRKVDQVRLYYLEKQLDDIEPPGVPQ